MLSPTRDTVPGIALRSARALLSVLVVLTCACSQKIEASPGAHAEPAQLAIGTVTHFGQGWPRAYLATIDASAAPIVRDGLRWKTIETAPGRYTFDAANSGFIGELCARKRKVLIVLNSFHPAYDAGQPVSSPEGIAAFARYAGAVADRFADCLAGIEIGNEINGAGGKAAVAAGNDSNALVAMLAQVRAAVKPRHPDLPLIGISVHSVALGFVGKLFDAGALDQIDGIAVHPYRRDPVNVDLELLRLCELMAKYGRPVPIWVTEFGIGKLPPQDTAVFLAKMAALMSSAGIANAQWYAQIEEPAFPGMGLNDTRGRPTAMATALNYLQRDVFSKGPAVRLFPGQTDVSAFAFGNARTLAWGEPGRTLTIEGSAVARDVTGRPIGLPTAFSQAPFVLEGPARIVPGPRIVLADSLLDYGRTPWTYLTIDRAGEARPLDFVDTRFGSTIGDDRRRITINQVGLLLKGGGHNPPQAVFRYTATDDGPIYALTCARQRAGQPVTIGVLKNNRVTGTSTTALDIPVQSATRMTVARGDRIDFVFSSDTRGANAAIAYRLRIARSGDLLACPDLSARGRARGRQESGPGPANEAGADGDAQGAGPDGQAD